MDWKHALDIQHDTCRFYNSDNGIYEGSWFLTNLFDNSKTPDSTLLLIYRQMLEVLHQGDTIFVTSDMLHLAMQAGHDLPAGTAFDLKSLLSRRGFVLFEEKIVGLDAHENPIVINAMGWEKAFIHPNNDDELFDGVSIFFFTDPYDMEDSANQKMLPKYQARGPVPPLVIAHYFPLVDGYIPVEDERPGYKIVTEMVKFFMALMYLSHQTIGEPVQLRPDRHTRKRAQREWNMNEPLITVITLRRKSVKKDNEEPGKVEWSRRWLVKGFWRKQWYPSLGIHQPVYIHDYIKGPEDKPFIPPSGRVFNFRR